MPYLCSPLHFLRYEALVTGDSVKKFMKVVEKEVMALMMAGMGEHDEM